MSLRSVSVMIALVLLSGVVAAAPVGTFVYAGGPSAAATQSSNASNVKFGAAISSFMQASAADTAGEVDNEMFAAEFNNTDDRQAKVGLVRSRAKNLQSRLERLRESRAELLNSDGGVNVSERARAARLAARAQTLQRAINQTESAADRVGVNTALLERLRQNARILSGPEVAALATGLVDTPGGGLFSGTGPPADRRNENETGPPENVPADPSSPADDAAPNLIDRNENSTNASSGTNSSDSASDDGLLNNGNSSAGNGDARAENNDTRAKNDESGNRSQDPRRSGERRQ